MLHEQFTPEATERPVHIPLPVWLSIASGVLWTATCFLVVLHAVGSVRGFVYYFVMLLAVMTTLVALMAHYTQAIRREVAQEHAAIHEAIGDLAAQMEQLGQKVDRIDPWTIYTALAEDLLGQDAPNRRRS